MEVLEYNLRGKVKENWDVYFGEEKFIGYTMVIFKCVKGWKRK